MSKLFKIFVGILAVLCLGISTLVLTAQWVFRGANQVRYSAPEFSMAAEMKKANPILGKHIVHVRSGCASCHGADLGGQTFIDYFLMGKISAPGLTPAQLRDWSDEEIASAIRLGISRDGRPLNFMPSLIYHHLAKEDVASAIAYLRTLSPAKKTLPEVRVGPMAKVFFLFGKMPSLIPAKSIDMKLEWTPKPKEGPTAEFGKYLVDNACVSCHGADLRGGVKTGIGKDFAVPEPLRLGGQTSITEQAFIESLKAKKSLAHDGAPYRDPMDKIPVNEMTEVERTAIAKYLFSLSP